MTDALLIAAIAAVPATIAALAAWFKAAAAHEAIKAVHVEVNSRLTELLRVGKQLAHLEGIAEGKRIEKEKADADRNK
jgi:hypothetical protein